MTLTQKQPHHTCYWYVNGDRYRAARSGPLLILNQLHDVFENTRFGCRLRHPKSFAELYKINMLLLL